MDKLSITSSRLPFDPNLLRVTLTCAISLEPRQKSTSDAIEE